MDCRRCGEPNLPGLTDCFSCGRPLSEPVPELSAYTPKVSARNPLERRARPRLSRPQRAAPEFAPQSRVALLRAAPPALWPALIFGWVPGLIALSQGERGRAALQLVLLGLSVAASALALVWGPQHMNLTFALTWICWSLSPVQALLSALEPRYARPAALPIALALTLAVGTLVRFGVGEARDAVVPMVRIPEQSGLAGGTFLVRPYRDEAPQIGDLVAAEQGRFNDSVVAPVIALEGQTVTPAGQSLEVDGVLTDVLPVDRSEQGYAINWGRSHITPGPDEVVLYINPLRVVPEREIVGRVFYRWTPFEDRGPVSWPPEETSEDTGMTE